MHRTPTTLRVLAATCALVVGTRGTAAQAQRTATVARSAQRVDVDFDGDLDEVRARGACTGNCYFDVWLRRGGRLVYSPALSALPSPMLDRSTRTVVSLEAQGIGGARFRATRFAIHDGQLRAVEAVTQRDEPSGSGTFRRTVYDRRSGRARVVCSAIVDVATDHERVVRIDVGTPERCEARFVGEWLEPR